MPAIESLDTIVNKVRNAVGPVEKLRGQQIERTGLVRYTLSSSMKVCAYWTSWLSADGDFREDMSLIGNMCYDIAATAVLEDSWIMFPYRSSPRPLPQLEWSDLRREAAVLSYNWLQDLPKNTMSIVSTGSHYVVLELNTGKAGNVEITVDRASWLPRKLTYAPAGNPATAHQLISNEATIKKLAGPGPVPQPSAIEKVSVHLRGWRVHEGIQFPSCQIHVHDKARGRSRQGIPGATERRLYFTQTVSLRPTSARARAPRQHSPSHLAIANNQHSVTLDFQLINGIICLPVNVAGQDLLFALDTGTSATTINFDTANQLDLKLRCDFTNLVGGGSNASRIDLAEGVELTMGDLSLSNENVLVLDMNPLLNSIGHRLDGILGTTFMNQLVTEVDFCEKIVRFTDKATFKPNAEDYTLELDMGGQVPVVKAALELDGESHPIRLMIDTGYGGGQGLLNEPFVKEHRLTEKIRPTVGCIAQGVGGTVEIDMGRFRGLKLGEYHLAETVLGLSVTSSGSTGDSGYDGFIGNEVLRHSRVTFNYRDSLIHFSAPQDASRYEYNMSGLSVSCRESFQDFAVTYVARGTPGHAAKIRRDDRIIGIDGKMPKDLSAIGERLRHPGEVALRLSRHGTEREVSLHLQALI